VFLTQAAEATIHPASHTNRWSRVQKDGSVSLIDRRDVPWLRPSTIRKVRLCTGLVLFTYISAHLLNHSLGNFSLAWAEDGLLVHKFVWQSVIGTTVLYGAFILHFFSGPLRAL